MPPRFCANAVVDNNAANTSAATVKVLFFMLMLESCEVVALQNVKQNYVRNAQDNFVSVLNPTDDTQVKRIDVKFH